MLTKYVCSDGVDIPIDECLRKCRLKNRCLPLGALMLLKSEHTLQENVFSVTEITQPLLQTILKRKHDYAMNPISELQPIMVGIAWHKIMENGKEGDIETTLERKLGDVIIRGRPDLILEDGITIDEKLQGKTIVDYKTTSKRRLLVVRKQPPQEWIEQGRFYNFLLDFTAANVVFWVVSVDEAGNERIVIPPGNPKEIIEILDRKVKLLLRYSNSDELPQPCNDRYQNDLRCKKYCVVNRYCYYYQNFVQPKEEIKSSKKTCVVVSRESNPVLVQAIREMYYAKVEIPRAKKEIEEQKSKIKTFMAKNPNTVIIAKDDYDEYEVYTSYRSKTAIDFTKIPKEIIEQAKVKKTEVILNVKKKGGGK